MSDNIKRAPKKKNPIENLGIYAIKKDYSNMVEKYCYKCNTTKPISEFNKNKNKHDGLSSECRDCVKQYKKDNHERLMERQKEYYKLNPEVKKKSDKKYYKKNKDKIKEYKKDWDNKNREQLRVKSTERARKYRKNPHNRILGSLRARINNLIRKENSTFELVGCDREFLLSYLEKQFTDGMTWGNYGKYGWHIDHIIPCSVFDLTNVEEQKICFNYKNLQPLWAFDNWSKGNKINCKTVRKQQNAI